MVLHLLTKLVEKSHDECGRVGRWEVCRSRMDQSIAGSVRVRVSDGGCAVSRKN
jgi:hypothetical protein